MVSLEITVSDFKNHNICEFGQLWRLLEGEQCKIRNLSWRYRVDGFFEKNQCFLKKKPKKPGFFRVWSTLEAPGRRTVQNRKFFHGNISCLKYNF